jgi:hypothetical protein
MAGSTAQFHAQRLSPRREDDVQGLIFRCAKVVVDATDGSDLEAVLDLGGGHVLFLTYDSPFDEGLHLIYLDGADVLRDEARIGFLYPGASACCATCTRSTTLAPSSSSTGAGDSASIGAAGSRSRQHHRACTARVAPGSGGAISGSSGSHHEQGRSCGAMCSDG